MKPSMRKRALPYLAVFEAEGVEVETEISSGTHFKFLARKGSSSRSFFAPFSPSDSRGIKNFRGDVRRWANMEAK